MISQSQATDRNFCSILYLYVFCSGDFTVAEKYCFLLCYYFFNINLVCIFI